MRVEEGGKTLRPSSNVQATAASSAGNSRVGEGVESAEGGTLKADVGGCGKGAEVQTQRGGRRGA